jgi:uncharacterized protein YbaR (Trm112 family)
MKKHNAVWAYKNNESWWIEHPVNRTLYCFECMKHFDIERKNIFSDSLMITYKDKYYEFVMCPYCDKKFLRRAGDKLIKMI